MTAIRSVISCLALVCAFGIANGDAAAQPPPPPDPTQEEETSDKSRDDLILEQLAALRQEMQALRRDVQQIRRSLTEIRRAALRPNAPPTPPTPPPPAKVSLDDDEVMGGPEAKVAIVEFSDFQCPFCSRFHAQTFPNIKETYIDTGKVQYIFRDFPLMQAHPLARGASVAANCGGKQGKYWEMHHALYENQKRLGPELYTELAQSFNLDLAEFETCLQDPAEEQEVDKDLAYGQSIGVRGTPHFFLGRIEGGELIDVRRVNGAQAFPAFANILDELLK